MPVAYGILITTPDPEFVFPAIVIPIDSTQTYALITLYFGISNTYTEKVRAVVEWSYKGVSHVITDTTVDANTTIYVTPTIQIPLSDVQQGFTAGECVINGKFIVTAYKYNPASGAYDAIIGTSYKDVKIRLIDPTDPSWVVIKRYSDGCPFDGAKSRRSTPFGEGVSDYGDIATGTVSTPTFTPPSACIINDSYTANAGSRNCGYVNVDLRGRGRCYLLFYINKQRAFTLFDEKYSVGFPKAFIDKLPNNVWIAIGIILPIDALTINLCIDGVYPSGTVAYMDEWWIVCK